MHAGPVGQHLRAASISPQDAAQPACYRPGYIMCRNVRCREGSFLGAEQTPLACRSSGAAFVRAGSISLEDAAQQACSRPGFNTTALTYDCGLFARKFPSYTASAAQHLLASCSSGLNITNGGWKPENFTALCIDKPRRCRVCTQGLNDVRLMVPKLHRVVKQQMQYHNNIERELTMLELCRWSLRPERRGDPAAARQQRSCEQTHAPRRRRRLAETSHFRAARWRSVGHRRIAATHTSMARGQALITAQQPQLMLHSK